MADSSKPEMVTLSIDGQEVTVPKGMNLIEASKLVDVEVPYYCYHPDLSVAGNCRMCQVEVEGMPKLTIGCNTGATEGMVVKTQKTSERVADAQRATLEFLLINHPLDCTVCDQAGHCKLQDYYYDYNAKPSRFVEEKVNKVKAQPLGPEIIYDGERCILCTRCVRFCDEVSKTSELGLYNRGDKAVIGIHPANELNNPLSGNVVDLCPVGALTHRRWRFNSRIWYTKEVKSVCMGCSTGCNVKVCTRDEEFVQVKGRYNSEVHGEWLCDEGRYGFERFQPTQRLEQPYLRSEDNYLEPRNLEEALNASSGLYRDKSSSVAVFLSPFLSLEEMWLAVRFAKKSLGIEDLSSSIAVQCKIREVGEVEKFLVSPDYSPNAASGALLGLFQDNDSWRASAAENYQKLLAKLRSKEISRVLLVGDFAIDGADLDEKLVESIVEAEVSVSLSSFGVVAGESLSEGTSTVKEPSVGAQQLCKVLLPTHSVYEKSGTMVNADFRLQRINQALPSVDSVKSIPVLLSELSQRSGRALCTSDVSSSKALFKEMISELSGFEQLDLRGVGDTGVDLKGNTELGNSENDSGHEGDRA